MTTTDPTRRIDVLPLGAGVCFLLVAIATLVGDVFDIWGLVATAWPFVALVIGVALVLTTMSRDRNQRP